MNKGYIRQLLLMAMMFLLVACTENDQVSGNDAFSNDDKSTDNYGLRDLHQGIKYSEARKNILDSGWQRTRKRWQFVSSQGNEHLVYYNNLWSEVSSCATTGAMACSFEFHDIHHNKLIVRTVGECVDDEGESPEEGEKCDIDVSDWNAEYKLNIKEDIVNPEGLRQGMEYSKARKIILNSGWQGVGTREQDLPEWGQELHLYHINGWKEVDGCSSIGLSFCRFNFTDINNTRLVVVTAGECLNEKDEFPEENEKCVVYLETWFVEYVLER